MERIKQGENMDSDSNAMEGENFISDSSQTRGKLGFEFLIMRQLDRCLRIAAICPQKSDHLLITEESRDYTFRLAVKCLHSMLRPYYDEEYLTGLKKIEAEANEFRKKINEIENIPSDKMNDISKKAAINSLRHDFDKTDHITALARDQLSLIMGLLHRQGLLLEDSDIGEL